MKSVHNNTFKKYVALFVKVLISILVFVFVIHKVTQNETINLISILSFRLISIICLTGAIQISINALIQKKLLLIYNIALRYKEILIHNIISNVYVMFIPGFVAPDFYLGYQYSKGNNKYSRIFSVLFLNRSIGFIISALLTIISLLILGKELIEKIDLIDGYSNYSFLIIAIPIIVATIIGIIVKFKEKLRKIGYKISEIWNETKENMIGVFNALSIKLGFYLVGLTGRLLLGYSVGVDLPILEFAAIIIVLNFLISLPISFNGVGVREAGYVGLLSLMGVSSKTALLFALSEFGISLFTIIIGSLLYFNKNLKTAFKISGD